jgi:L-alanine-DL-glutamate epimerase-like enolase superfamily enzyme
MRITRVTTAVVEANFDYTFVRIHTDEGLHGTGEAFFAPGITAVIRDLGGVLVGEDPRRIRLLWERLVRAAGGTACSGIAFNAISGLEAALWDLNGKVLGQPIAALLGGRQRDWVEVYVDLHAGTSLQSLDRVLRYRSPFWLTEDRTTRTAGSYWETPEAQADSLEGMVARAKEAVEAGFRKLKFDLDVFSDPRDPGDRTMTPAMVDRVAERAAALRRALGDQVEVAFDCHWRFDVPTATAIAQAVAVARPVWLEDPVPPDPRALAAVTARSPVPVATGENLYLLESFLDLIRCEGARILTPDAQRTGGLSELLRIADVAARHLLPVAPHCIASPLGFLASVHVASVCSNTLSVEFHGFDVPFWSELVTAPGGPLIRDGRCRVPDAPGVGVEVDLDTVRAYAAPGEPVFDEGPAR